MNEKLIFARCEIAIVIALTFTIGSCCAFISTDYWQGKSLDMVIFALLAFTILMLAIWLRVSNVINTGISKAAK